MNHSLVDFENVRIDVQNNNHSGWSKISDNARGALDTSARSVRPSSGSVNIAQVRNDGPSGVGQIVKNANEKHRNTPKGRFCSIEEGLESTISNEAKDRITRIVNEAKSLSDVEKLFLYLRLPTGDATSDELRQTPTSCLHTSKRVEQGQAYTWIKSHLEEDSEICLPKQEVYEDYRQYCDNHTLRPLSTADFGKLMKCVFPNVKPRRLGQRGQSKYCYGGLRKKLDIDRPSLPELEISPRKQQDQSSEDDELFTASCQLVLEWASKLFSQNFTGVRELSEYLLSNLYVNSKSVAAFTVIAAMQESGLQNLKVPSLFSNTTGGDRHKETQLQLQRKLQEREHIAKQKKILQKQREENQQKLKQAQDRQTPLITSPTIQQVITSPARKIFLDGIPDVRSKSGAKVEQSTRSQSVMMVDPVPSESTSSEDSQRSKSTTFVSSCDTPVTNSAADIIKKSGSCKPGITNDTGQVFLDKVDSRIQMNTLQCLRAQIEAHRDGSHQQRLYRLSSDSDMDLTTDDMVNDPREKSPFHTIKMPDVFSRISDPSSSTDLGIIVSESLDLPNNLSPQDSDSRTTLEESPNIPSATKNSETPVPSSIRKSHKKSSTSASCPDIRQEETLSCADNLMQKVLTTSSMEQLTLSSTPSPSPHTDTQPLGLGASSSDRVHLVHKETSLFISQASSVSSRSAFVPFKVQSRKEQPHEITNQSRNPSLNTYEQSQEEKKFLDSPTKDTGDTENSPKTLVVMTTNPSTKNYNEPDKISHGSLSPGENPLLKVTPTIVVPVSNMTTTVANTTTSTVTPTSGEPISAPSTLQSSPLTQKKTRTRFTPIRPKASPVKTVSSILKEQKTLSQPEPEKYDKSKLVSALLKEKRAREAQLQSQNTTAGSGVVAATKVASVIPQVVPISPLSGLSTIQGGKIHVPMATNPGNPSEIYIILSANPNLNQNQVVTPSRSTSTPVTETSSRTSCEASVSIRDVCTTSSSIPPSSRSRTNSSSEREFESPMQLSQDVLTVSDLSDSSINDDEKPSKLVKIVDSDQNVSSRPGSRCSVDRETPSFFGRKRKMTNSHSSEMNAPPGSRHIIKRVNSMEDNESLSCELSARISASDTPGSLQRPYSCSAEIDNKEFQGQSSSVFDDHPMQRKSNDPKRDSSRDSKRSELEHYPDIYDLEFDALLDSMPVDPSPLLKSDSPRQQMQSTAVGVTSLSLRQSQQKLLKEKTLLDERMKSFLQQRVTPGGKTPNDALKNNVGPSRKDMFDFCPNISDTQAEKNKNEEKDMEIGGELPPDVADFITDAMTGIENTNINGSEGEEDMGLERMVVVDYNGSPVIIPYEQRTKSAKPRRDTHIESGQDKLRNIKEHLTLNLQGQTSTEEKLRMKILQGQQNISSSVSEISTYLHRSQSVTFSESHARADPTSHGRSQSVTLTEMHDGQEERFGENFCRPGQTQVSQKPSGFVQNVSDKVRSKSLARQTGTSIQEIRGAKPPDSPASNDHFASPQRPLRRQRTPSVERNTSQTPTKFTSPIQQNIQKKLSRDGLVEYTNNQTTFSDPGYGSVAASPILTTPPVSSGGGLCDSTYSSMANSSLLSGRPESAQSIASDSIAPSPISFASPRFQTSTPYPLRSPCPTSNQHIQQSPGPVEGPVRAFMPIQLTSHQLNTNVTLIKPLVTIPNQQGHPGKKENPELGAQLIQGDLIGIGSIEPKNQGHTTLSSPRLPPPYSAAVQGLQQAAAQGSVGTLVGKEGAFDILKSPAGKKVASNIKGNMGPQNVKHSTAQDPKSTGTPGVQENLSEVYPFSYKLAQLSSRTLSTESDTSDSETADKVLGMNNIDAKNLEAKKMLNTNLPHTTFKKCQSKEQSIRSILGHLHSPLESPTKGNFPRAMGSISQNNDGNIGMIKMQVDELPSANYTGEQPNIEVTGNMLNTDEMNLLQDVQGQLIHSGENKLSDSVVAREITRDSKFFSAMEGSEFSARRNLTDILNEQCTEIDEDDLQTTLDDLKSVDSQYFEHEFEFRVTKRQ